MFLPVLQLTYMCKLVEGGGKTKSTQVRTTQLDGGTNSHLFTNITMFTYIKPVKFNVKRFNIKKSPAKGFGFVTVKIPKTNIIFLLWPSYYIPQNLQNTIIQNSLIGYNRFISFTTESLIWLQITTDTGNKLNVGTTAKETYQQLLDFVTIDVIKF